VLHELVLHEAHIFVTVHLILFFLKKKQILVFREAKRISLTKVIKDTNIYDSKKLFKDITADIISSINLIIF